MAGPCTKADCNSQVPHYCYPHHQLDDRCCSPLCQTRPECGGRKKLLSRTQKSPPINIDSDKAALSFEGDDPQHTAYVSHLFDILATMSAAQLLNPKAESRVRSNTDCDKLDLSHLCGLLMGPLLYRGGVKLSRSTSVPVRACRMCSNPTSALWAR